VNSAEVLSAYERRQRLKVGSLNGFFYIGYVGDYLDRMAEISGDIYRYFSKRKVSNARQYEFLVKHSPERLWEISQRKISYEYAEARVKNFVPLGKRLVKDIYRSENDWDGDCVIMIVEGEEMGKFWTWQDAEPGSAGVGATGSGGAICSDS